MRCRETELGNQVNDYLLGGLRGASCFVESTCNTKKTLMHLD